MARQSSNFRFFRGDTQPFWLDFTIGKLPLNIAGYSLYLTMKANLNDPDAAATYQKKIVLPDDEESQAGRCIITIESNESDAIEPGRYFYDMQMVAPGAPPIVITFISGILLVLADVTRTSAI